jgi:hypothetical protein
MKNPNLAKHLREVNQRLRRDSWNVYHGFLSRLLASYDHLEIARKMGGFLRSRSYDHLLAFADSLSEQTYSDATEHFVANQIALLVRKYPFPKGTVNTDPEGAAVKKFLQSERKCARMNRFFSLLQKRNPYEYQLSAMRSFITYVIGQSPDMEKVTEHCDFGSGASLGVHGNRTHLGSKISSKVWTVSAGAAVYGFNAIMSHAQLRELLCEEHGSFYCIDPAEAWKRYLSRCRITSNNKISFVPKTAKTHRAIAVEPLVNGFLQKGIDEVLRIKLRRINIDLRDQTKNQRMAREGSLDDSENSFVTMDLSSASDSISIGLARELLPPDWFYLLDSTRSRDFELNGVVKKYHKFCSMGNGFCFPLQTLIFVAACHACGSGVPGTDFSVYGDDIIVRRKHAQAVIKLLTKLGFSLNKDKTFLEGPFRESCGEDWFGGKAVRPYTLDYAFDSIENVFKFLNFTRRKEMLSHFFSEVRPYVLGLLPPRFHLLRPYPGNEDSGIDSDFTEFLSCPYARYDKRIQAWSWLELRHRAVLDREPFDDERGRVPAEVYGLLRGASSVDSKRIFRDKLLAVNFTLRRKVQTNVARTCYSGATSLWLPPLAA